MSEDITREQKKDKCALEQVFERNKLDFKAGIILKILDNILENVLVIDADSKIVYINPAYSQNLNVLPEKILGKKLKDVEPSSRVFEVLKNGQPLIDYTSRIHSLGLDVVARDSPLFDGEQLIGAVSIFKNITDIIRLNREIEHFKEITQMLQQELSKPCELPASFGKVLGRSTKLLDVLVIAAKAAATQATILIRGESGVGKEVLASSIHETSNRAGKPFVKLNCAAIPESLLESELFGYEEGAFTGAKHGGKKGKFEHANGGTLFLDEIGDMSLAMQAKLLRSLQEKEIERLGGKGPLKVDVRIIAATNRDLRSMMEKGEFREDLFYRLNVVPLYLPPLRERREDILLLAEHFLEQLNRTYQKNFVLSPQVMSVLCQQKWPGNVRELQNVLEHAGVVCQDSLILVEHLPSYLRYQGSTPAAPHKSLKLKELLETVEKEAIATTMQLYNNNRTKTIDALGLSRRAFYQKLHKYNLE